MRIAFFTTEYAHQSYGTGGLASYLRQVTRSLAELGHEPEVFALAPKDATFQDGAVLVHDVAGTPLPLDWMSRVRFVWRLRELLRRWEGYETHLGHAWYLYRAFARRHREKPFDIVQSANNTACGLIAALRKPLPVVTRVSTWQPLWREANRSPLTRGERQRERAESWQLRFSSSVYSPSRFLADLLHRQRHLAVDVVEPPFDKAALPPLEAPLPVPLAPLSYGIFFGGLGYMKGCDRLLEVLPDLLDRNPDMAFVFVGRPRPSADGVPFDQHIREQLGRFGTRVAVLPELAHAELFPLVAHARLVALPSRIDNLPNTCLEAMALRRVVIATKNASFEQLIADGETGFLVDQDDGAALGQRMEQVWRMDPAAREHIGDRAAQSLDRLRPQQATRALVDYYQATIAGRPRRGIAASAPRDEPPPYAPDRS